MTKVSLLGCADYERDNLVRVIEEGLRNINFDLVEFENKRVGLKPNILFSAAPETAITTHPAFFAAAAEVVKTYGGQPIMIESPAIASLRRVIEKTDFKYVIQEQNIEVANDAEIMILRGSNGTRFRRFEILKGFSDIDIIMNLPKLKTHDLTYMSGCVKNLFGMVHGMKKAQSHAKAKNPIEFSGLLLDLYCAILTGFEPPQKIVHVMDAILAMEGDGPGKSGTPRPVGAVLTGSDGIAVDYVASQLLSLDLDRIYTITKGLEREVGISSFDEVDIVGHELDQLRIHDFQLPSTRPRLHVRLEQRFIFSQLFKELFLEKPVPTKERCSLCYDCSSLCPVGAIACREGGERVPRYDYGKCIRCYCCMEICPEAAIELKRGWLQRIVR